jgi:hypothetical protein
MGEYRNLRRIIKKIHEIFGKKIWEFFCTGENRLSRLNFFKTIEE